MNQQTKFRSSIFILRGIFSASNNRQLQVLLGFNQLQKQMDQEKSLSFKTFKNDGNQNSQVQLINYKTIVGKALPNMDKAHIVRLIFDAKHESLLIYQNEVLIGGACYASFQGKNFVELAFFAIKAKYRIKGYGKKLMNKLKSELQAKKVEYIITYGDNLALGFFRKQGFSQKITAPYDNYEGFIKQYDGGTLVECKIHPSLDYMMIDQILKKQKNFVLETIKNRSLNETKFLGSKLQELITNQKFARKNPLGQTESFKINPKMIPGVVESGWDWQQHDQLNRNVKNSFQNDCKELLDSIKRHPEAKFFLYPVSEVQVPIYYKVIKHPMDLQTIRRKIASNSYECPQDLCKDLELMFKNCAEFNEPGTVYAINGARLQQAVKPQLQAFKQMAKK